MSPLFTIFAASVLVGFAIALVSNILGVLHDYRQKQKQRKYPLLNSSTVTIVIPAYNEERVIERCLRSVEQLHHSNLSVVVVDDASSDSTSERAQKLLTNSTLRDNSTVVRMAQNTGKGLALNYALEHYVESEFVVILDADCTIHPDALTYILREFEDPRVGGVASNVRISTDPSLLSYLQMLEFILGFRQKRAFDAAGAEFIIGGQGSAYRTEVLKSVGGFKKNMQTEDIELSLSVLAHPGLSRRIAFASHALVFTEAVPDIRGLFRQRYRWKFGAMQAVIQHRNLIFDRGKRTNTLLSWYRLPQLFIGEALSLLEPVILSLLITLTIASGSIVPLLGAWFSFSLYALTTIIIDDHTNRRQKIILALLAPILFPFFYVFMIINFFALIKVLRNYRGLIRPEHATGNWTPPTRVGKAVL